MSRTPLLALAFFLSLPTASAYSVLTHEAIIDSVWDTSMRAVLLARFPNATPAELLEAHAYAYGGSIIQDLGYYPFGSAFYSDLTHYVRSGDFILSLLRNSENLNEYAFALGALSHYAADSDGHSMATNVSVPLLYPVLKAKFGNRVTYSDDHISHSKTEFGFDVFQASKSRYASDGYKAFIGFQVAKPVLERAFLETYGMPIDKVFLSFDLAIGSYRRAVGTILPAMTRIAWQLNKDEIRREVPGMTRQKFLYNLSRASYEKDWGSTYTKPSWWSQFLAFVFRVVPKVGPLKPLQYKKVTPEIEKLYMASVNATVDRYKALLATIRTGNSALPNQNFDVGEPTAPGKYKLADAAYAKLLHKLNGHYIDMPPALRADILAYYRDLDAPLATKENAEDWDQLLAEIAVLRGIESDASGQPADPVPQAPKPVPVEQKPPAPTVKHFIGNIVQDQKQIWTSPFRMKKQDVKWWVGFGAVTGALIATDHQTSRVLPNTLDQATVSGHISQLGAAYTLIPAAAGMYLVGSLTKDSKLRDTGLLGGEAMLDALIVSEGLKFAAGRQRPTEGDGNGHFFRRGDSFPSGHATESFALASVIAHQYEGRKMVAILAYGFATAVSASRLSARRHFPSDVVAGGAIGWFIGRHVSQSHDPSRHASSKAWLSPQLIPQVQPSTRTYGVGLLWSPAV